MIKAHCSLQWLPECAGQERVALEIILEEDGKPLARYGHQAPVFYVEVSKMDPLKAFAEGNKVVLGLIQNCIDDALNFRAEKGG